MRLDRTSRRSVCLLLFYFACVGVLWSDNGFSAFITALLALGVALTVWEIAKSRRRPKVGRELSG
ncbi:hypothetical protein [Antrihabitans cavernicola]|uniref:Uncharacterized protein n=1 Tax=Antrihabitans cavernicola TaxID=2495913 RepID=A0A5A7SIY9_9NOCA|nr:hypothetical protein [Spelaeibacter cavernicola]KAA0024563.1 hypothetical protein FOY51_00960 [Spelaeibacter cavernicola]